MQTVCNHGVLLCIAKVFERQNRDTFDLARAEQIPLPNKEKRKHECNRRRCRKKNFSAALSGLTQIGQGDFLQTRWNPGISDVLQIKVNEPNAGSVLDFALSEVVEIRTPKGVFCQVLRDALGKKNVVAIAATHDPLRDINSG